MRKSGYYWKCWHDNGLGMFNPDREFCEKKSRLFSSKTACIESARAHGCLHVHEGWGYNPDYRPSMDILRRDRMGREYFVCHAFI